MLKKERKEYNRNYYINNKDDIKKRQFKNKDKIKKYKKTYHKNNKISIQKYNKQYWNNNKNELSKQKKEYFKNNYSKVMEKICEYREKNRTIINNNALQYYYQNKILILERMKNYYICNKEKRGEYNKKYYEKNKDKFVIISKKYFQDNKYKIYELIKIKKIENISYHISCKLRTSLSNALRIYTKTGKYQSSKKYGIDYEAIIEHLRPFPKDISKYHLDHKTPLCSFDLTNPKEVKKAFAPENHQFLLIKDNLSKATQDKKLKINGDIYSNGR